MTPVVGGSSLPLSVLPKTERAPTTMTKLSTEAFRWEADSCYYEVKSPVKSGGMNSDLPWIPGYTDGDTTIAPCSPTISHRSRSVKSFTSSPSSSRHVDLPPPLPEVDYGEIEQTDQTTDLNSAL